MRTALLVLQLAGSILLLLAALYLGVASAAWSLRNPTANDSTLWTEFPSVVTFQKLDKYQGQ
jgi:hypothetical protein